MDTTVCIERVIAEPEIRAKLNISLQEYPELRTCYQVWREYLRTIVQDLLEIEELCAATRIGEGRWISLANLSRTIRTSGYERRRKNRKAAVLEDLLERFDRNQVHQFELVSVLQELRQLYVRIFFCSDLDHLEQQDIHCHREPLLEPEDVLSELRATALATSPSPYAETALAGFPPGAGTFLAAHEEEVEAVDAAMASLPDGPGKDKKLLTALGWIRRKGNGNYDFEGWFPGKKRRHWYLSDLLIALSAPRGTMIASKDHAFRILCSALGRELLTYDELLSDDTTADD